MINVLERITNFRVLKGWTEYQLAEKSGLTQSTISSWYRKNMIPSFHLWKKYVRHSVSRFLSFLPRKRKTFH